MEKKTLELATTMTEEERQFQHDTLLPLRHSMVIPGGQTIAMKTGVSPNTVNSFFHGNSPNETIRNYVRTIIAANYKEVPPEFVTLFAIWDRDKRS